MKRKIIHKEIEIVVGDKTHICVMCRHTRVDQPYAIFHRLDSKGNDVSMVKCWKCCRDPHSTLLIKQKWPMAFDLHESGPYHLLKWNQTVQLLIGDDDEI